MLHNSFDRLNRFDGDVDCVPIDFCVHKVAALIHGHRIPPRRGNNRIGIVHHNRDITVYIFGLHGHNRIPNRPLDNGWGTTPRKYNR